MEAPSTRPPEPMARLVDVLIGVSFAADVGTGQPIEDGLRVCLVATALARDLGLHGEPLRATFQAALLHGLGCTAHTSENAEMFGDDRAFHRAFRVFDPGDPTVAARQLTTFGDWAGPARQAELARRFVEAAPTVGPYAGAACAEVSVMLGAQLGLSPGAVVALTQIYERHDGLGIPAGLRGDAVALPARLVSIAEQVVIELSNRREAVPEIRRRSGGHLDPDVCTAFLADPDRYLAAARPDDLASAVREAEPLPAVTRSVAELPELCSAIAAMTDLKGTHLLGHSESVAALAHEAARLAGVDEEERATLRCAALVHDVGRLAVPSSVWDRAGPLGPADVERVILHPHWTMRILGRCPTLAPMADLAASHHERLDGEGYHRALAGDRLSWSARLTERWRYSGSPRAG